MELHQVKEIKVERSEHRTNRYIEDGWVLLKILEVREEIPTGIVTDYQFILGRVE